MLSFSTGTRYVSPSHITALLCWSRALGPTIALVSALSACAASVPLGPTDDHASDATTDAFTTTAPDANPDAPRETPLWSETSTGFEYREMILGGAAPAPGMCRIWTSAREQSIRYERATRTVTYKTCPDSMVIETRTRVLSESEASTLESALRNLRSTEQMCGGWDGPATVFEVFGTRNRQYAVGTVSCSIFSRTAPLLTAESVQAVRMILASF